MKRFFQSAAPALLVAILIAAVALGGSGPSINPLNRVNRDGDTMTGTLTNTYGSPMANIQLLAQALDAENKVLAQKIVWFGRHLEPFGSSYFEIAGLPVAQNYKVSVWSFDVIQSDSPRW